MNYKKKINFKWTFEIMILCLSCKRNERCEFKKMPYYCQNKKFKNFPPLNEEFQN